MSLLVPDYSSFSEDEAPPRVASPPKPSLPRSPLLNEPPIVSTSGVEPLKPSQQKPTKKKTKKPKTTLFLPPEIQKLLESGNTLGDSNDEDDGDSLLAKQKRAVAKRPRTSATKCEESTTSTTLSFLPAPKHHIDEPKAPAKPEKEEMTTEEATVDGKATASIDVNAQQTYSYDQQQYTQYYQQYYHHQPAQHDVYQEEEQEPTSKRARHRDRELERMLQMGQFDAVADRIVEVSAPAPDAWQAPAVDELKKGSASDLKVKASFWNSSAGVAVSTAKPSRLQRQKHQLNQLAFDAKAREYELLERKGAAIKTKRETHAKYGW